jgi:Ca2+-binding RTX toxin-like protein
VTITQSGNSVIVEGVEAQWQILVIGDSAFNSIEIENADGIGGAEGDDFVIGEYVVSAEVSGEPIDLAFDVDVVDEDGDASDGTIDVTVLPQQVAGDGGATLTAGVNGGDLVGGDGNDSLVGSDADDKLQGGLGNDTIGDGAGNDLIIGGDGADVINLAADNVTDVLEYNDLSEGGDTVNGFDTDAPGNGDIIDLVDLLDGGSFTGTTLGEAIADGYVNLDDSGPDLLVQVDLNGGADSFSTIVTIAGIGAGNEALVTDNIVVD